MTLSVSQLNEYVSRTLQLDPVLRRIELKGEISNLKRYQTGTLFFTMKDEQASISCLMYAADAQELEVAPFEGMRAIASGSVGLYAREGRYQFYARALRADGLGALYERLIALRDKLAREGLFDEKRKRPLPLLPDTVGVVSSPSGAVIHDILNVSLRRNQNARVLLCPARVQGAGAADEVVRAIHVLEEIDEVSVIIIARGGGSLEDLWTFNEEAVVRAVAACKKPIVSAVGHETDVTLCDMAADLRAPTPSAAAECVEPVACELFARTDAQKRALDDALRVRLGAEQARLHVLCTRLGAMSPSQRIAMERLRLTGLSAALLHAQRENHRGRMQRLTSAKEHLKLLNPYGVLSRGYAIVLRDDSAVESADQLSVGECVRLRFAHSTARARIEEVEAHGREKECEAHL